MIITYFHASDFEIHGGPLYFISRSVTQMCDIKHGFDIKTYKS
jgi:hypothetical protein